MSNLQVLLFIAAFLILTIGSFIFYVATWSDRKAPQSASNTLSGFEISPPEAPSASKGTLT